MKPKETRLHIEASRYVVVGSFALILDVGIFNLLIFSTFWQAMPNYSISAKIVSSGIAVTAAFFGHKHWTFKGRSGSSNSNMQLAIFVLVNIVGLSIGLICLYTSREILGYTTPLADNISANFVGLILGTTFRFLASRKWVFTI